MTTVFSYWPSYSARAFSELDEVIENARAKLADVDYDTLVGTGLSGTVVVPILGRELGRHWAVVRKEESVHSSRPVLGTLGQRWVFVDDTIDTGATLQRVKRKIAQECTSTEYVGAYLYQFDTFTRGR